MLSYKLYSRQMRGWETNIAAFGINQKEKGTKNDKAKFGFIKRGPLYKMCARVLLPAKCINTFMI